jgi:LmbE family N-acetylglucosaminyl deacetylase
MVTAFTEPPPPDMKISPLAAALHYAWAGDYRQRLDEDRRVAGMLGARVVWLGLLDAVYRDPSLDDAALVDPAFDVRQDPTLRELTARLVRVIVEHRDALVFVPLGVGNHRDHLLCHAAAAAAERAAAPGTRFYYYEDFPYSTIAPADRRALSLGLSHPELIDISRTLWERVHLVGLYTSQLVSAFDEPDDRHALIRSYAVSVGRGGRPAERFWPGRHLPLPEFGGKAPA